MRAGDMRHTIRIEQRSTAQDAVGEPANVWTLLAERRAALDRAPGREVWASAQRSGVVPTVFRLRYLAGVLPSMRVVFNAKVFDILSAIDQVGRGEELIITAEEHVEVEP
jgi:head-tail adaptor